MTAIADRSRQRTLAMLLGTLLVLVLVPILGYVGVNAISNSTGGRDALADNLTIQEFPPTPTAALITTDQTGVLRSVTVFALHPNGVGGSAISVPITADTSFVEGDRRSLQAAYAEGGVDSVHIALESLLVLTVNFIDEAGESAMAEMLQPLAPITVDLPGDVTLAGTDDTTPETIPAGPVELSAEQVAEILTTGSGDEPESGRRPRLEAVWAGIAAAVGEGTGTVEFAAGAQPSTFDEYMARLWAGTMQARGLNATPIETTDDGYEVEEVSRAEALLVFGSIAPGSVSPPAPGLIFRLEAPPGYEAEVQRTIAKLVFLGGNVVSVDLTKQPQPDTVFIVPDEINRAEAGTTNAIFGDFTFEEPTVRIDGVDLTVILGTDYLATVDVQAVDVQAVEE